jgi:uncharacterized protein YcaQ
VKIVEVTQERARRIAVHAQALDNSATSVLGVVRRLGFLQMDPVMVVARPEHLVLYSRLGRFGAEELERLLWQEHKLFEWDAFLWPVEDLALVHARMRRHRAHPSPSTRRFLEANQRLRRYVLRELERSGPLLSRRLSDVGLVHGADHRWWGRGGGQLRLMLEILTSQGEIGVAGRVGGQRLWDLAERVYPQTETIAWTEASRRIEEKRRRSLGVWLERGRLYAHADANDEPAAPRLLFLSPFDRLIHDRRRAQALFDFNYRLEMYVPAAKRKYGYYVLPMLYGDRIVGRIDLARDRQSGGLRVNGIWWEDGTKPVAYRRALQRLERAVVASAR